MGKTKETIKKRFRLSHCQTYYFRQDIRGALTLPMGVRNRHIGVSWTGIKMPTMRVGGSSHLNYMFDETNIRYIIQNT